MKKPLESFDSRGFWSEWRGSNPRPDGPKPPALSTAPHPDKYVRFIIFAWKWDKLWSNANSTPFCVFQKCRKSAPLKAFRDFCFFTAVTAGHAPKPGAIPNFAKPGGTVGAFSQTLYTIHNFL